MQRRRRIKSFSKFPEPEVELAEVVEDVKTREYLSKFKEHHVRTVFYLALLGMTEEQMCVVFDVSMGAFNSWKHKHPTFFEALQKGKEQADAEVVYSLYQSAIGYEFDSEQIFMTKEKSYGVDDRGRTILLKEVPKVVRVPIRRKFAPNVKAAIKWLEIRQPAQWSAKQDQKQKLTLVQNNFNYTDLTLEELKVLQKLGLQNAPQDGQTFQTTSQQQLKELQL